MVLEKCKTGTLKKRRVIRRQEFFLHPQQKQQSLMTVDQILGQDNHNNIIVQIHNKKNPTKKPSSLPKKQHHYQDYDDEDIEACCYQHTSYDATQRYYGVKNIQSNGIIKTMTTTTRNRNNPLSTDQPIDHNRNFRSSTSSSLRSLFYRMILHRRQPSLPNDEEEENDDNIESSSSSSSSSKTRTHHTSNINTDMNNTSCRSLKSTVRGENHVYDNNTHGNSNSNNNNQNTKKRCGCSPILATAAKTIDKDAVGYALRICIVLTVSVLFVLFSPNNPYPQGSWVYITCCMVSWFPSSMDAASVLKKTIHRIVGTTIGAILALSVGFMVAQIDVTTMDNSGVRYQATVLGLSFGVLSFGLTFVVVHWKTVFGGYSYASILVLMTYGIAVLPFYNNETPEEKERMWEKACYRIANVIVGCLLSAAGSVLIMPKSTQDAIELSVARQIQFAGKSSNAVLQYAYHVFTQTSKPIPLAQVIGSAQKGKTKQKKCQAEEEEQIIIDTVHDQYAAAIKDLQASKALFGLLKYDPFYYWRRWDNGIQKSSPFQAEEAAVNLARAFRVQTTVILLDSIVRNDTDNKGQEHFTTEQVALFSRVGYLIKEVLTLPFCQKNSECALELCSIIGEVRQHALEASNNLQTTLHKKYTSVTSGEDENHRDKSSFSSAPSVEVPGWCLEKFVDELESPNSGMPMSMASASILFLELLEHLILRTLRLYMRNRNHENLTTVFKVGDAASKREQSYDGDDDGDDDGGD